ncbi:MULTISPECIES: cell wall hydrolase [unclassified Sphingomonas]|jgi:hypothetical protein|uniref:cell wall hydrolase n=1 Tax=unclassified Sphingomonas TaxID=196159 RepID=UPI00082C757D|nr:MULTISPECIES: cell wall hydrolase [unclassified Sphingomonas]
MRARHAITAGRRATGTGIAMTIVQPGIDLAPHDGGRDAAAIRSPRPLPAIDIAAHRRRRNRRNLILAVALAALLIFAAADVYFVMRALESSALPRQRPGTVIDVPPIAPVAPPSDPAALRKLTVEEALDENARIPFAKGPNPSAPALVVASGSPDWDRSVGCLTAAIYYEAGNEPLGGQQAVAQVVLNRVRHPTYPSTVCGVVYEGANRPTGCQFTFTCDGSTARAPDPRRWEQARFVAESALRGQVYAPVGLATHYHADYVVPYWASSLAKTIRIGRHIFYRWNGFWGTPTAFTQRYAGGEPMIGVMPDSAMSAAAPVETPETPTVATIADRPILAYRDAASRAAGPVDAAAVATDGPAPGAAGTSAAAAAAPGPPAVRKPAGRRFVIGMNEAARDERADRTAESTAPAP